MMLRAIIFIVLGLLAGTALWLSLKPESATVASTATPVQVFYRISESRVAQGPPLINVQQGELLQLTVVSDRADELHVHGYDLHAPLEAGQPATLEIPCELAGRFEIELHTQHLQMSVLQVHPRSN